MITIKVKSYDGKPLAEPLVAQFAEAGGTIGRAPGNALVLADPDRVISRAHATVFMRDGRFRLRDQGSASPTSVNGRPIGNGRDVEIADGDEVQIGRYAMIVEDMDATHSQHHASADATATGTLPPGAVLSWSDDAQPRADGISTFIMPAPEAAEPSPAPAAAHRDAPVAPPVPRAPLDGAATLPLRTSKSAPTPTTAASFTNDELLRGFLAGAGIPGQPIPGGLTPELMYQLGQLLRESTRGTLDLLLARAATKREVRAEMTIIVAQDNNPLKFSPNVDAALAALLTPRGHGFMPPLRAVRDAYEGLSSHQQGFVAGMRAVLDVVLARFNPADFERRLTQRSMTDSLLPMNRKAKLWDLFTELYGELGQQAAAEFHALFGQEFLRAYDAQIARLRETNETGPGASTP
jgi:FHA domain-containing protein/type VI secretion system protein